MKNMLMTIVALAVMPVSFAQDARIKDDLRQAVQGAMQEAETAIKAASAIPNGSPVAILPIKGDSDGWLAGQLKIALTRAGKTCVEGKEDPMWGAILKEIEWDERIWPPNGSAEAWPRVCHQAIANLSQSFMGLPMTRRSAS